MTLTSMFPSLPNFTAILSDVSLYANGVFGAVLPLVLAGLGVALTIMLIKWLPRLIKRAGRAATRHR